MATTTSALRQHHQPQHPPGGVDVAVHAVQFGAGAGYLPTLLAIFTSGDSSQHSLLTWVTWVGANATMAAWLYEHNGRRLNRAIAVNSCNSLMCLANIGPHRGLPRVMHQTGSAGLTVTAQD